MIYINNKDIISFMTENGKSEEKPLGLNKIFVEIKKMFGLRTAMQWLELNKVLLDYLEDEVDEKYYIPQWRVDILIPQLEEKFGVQNIVFTKISKLLIGGDLY